MLKKDLYSICSFYAISPIHAGSGSSLAAVDLPIQRERHTNWPHIQASAVKGAMRAHYRKFSDEKDQINLIFGSDEQDGGKSSENTAGSVAFSDAKLFAFPIRSNVAPFVWVTCPAVIKRLNSDLEFTRISDLFTDIPQVEKEKAVAFFDSVKDKVILEDTVVEIKEAKKEGISFIQSNFPQIDKLLIVSDEMFKYCVESCTEVQTNIKISSKTGTAEDGALRYQELLPSDSLLYSVVYYSASSVENSLRAENVKKLIQIVISDFMQIGGDETLGRGICRVKWINGGSK